MKISVRNKVYYWCKADLEISFNCSGCILSFKDSKDALLSNERASLIIWPLMSNPSELLNLGLFILLGDEHIGVLEMRKYPPFLFFQTTHSPQTQKIRIQCIFWTALG